MVEIIKTSYYLALALLVWPLTYVKSSFTFMAGYNSTSHDCSGTPKIIIVNKVAVSCVSTKSVCINGDLHGCNEENLPSVFAALNFGVNASFVGLSTYTEQYCSHELASVGVWVLATNSCINGISSSYRAVLNGVKEDTATVETFKGRDCQKDNNGTAGSSTILGPTAPYYCNSTSKTGLYIVSHGHSVHSSSSKSVKPSALIYMFGGVLTSLLASVVILI